MFKDWSRAAATAAAVGVAACVSAQISPTNVSSVRAGVFFPSDSRSRNVSETWFAAGVDFRVPFPGISVPGTGASAWLSFSADYYERGGNRSIPLIASYNIRVQKFTYSAGVGASFYRLAGGDERISLDFSASLSYALVDAPLPVYLQARYYQGPRDELRGIAVMVGVRF